MLKKLFVSAISIVGLAGSLRAATATISINDLAANLILGSSGSWAAPGFSQTTANYGAVEVATGSGYFVGVTGGHGNGDLNFELTDADGSISDYLQVQFVDLGGSTYHVQYQFQSLIEGQTFPTVQSPDFILRETGTWQVFDSSYIAPTDHHQMPNGLVIQIESGEPFGSVPDAGSSLALMGLGLVGILCFKRRSSR